MTLSPTNQQRIGDCRRHIKCGYESVFAATDSPGRQIQETVINTCYSNKTNTT